MSLADKFNLLDGWNVLRIICGVFFLPHIYGKFFAKDSIGFFTAAGFKPPKFWMYTAAVAEVVIAIGLIFGIYTQYAAALGAIHLLVACVGLHGLTKKWFWHLEGIEYPAFWGICCVILAMRGPWPY
ncbi:MAG: DoxX family protein [Pseudomonadota bacterium]